MHYFETFVSILTDAEASLLEQIAKTTAERAIVSHALAARSKKGSAKVAALQLSPATLRKTRSVLLKRAYTVIAPEGSIALLHFLCDRHSLELALHELRRFEQSEMSELAPQDQAAIYEGLYRKIILFPHTYDVLPTVRRLSVKRLKVLPGVSTIDQLEVECEILRKEIRMTFAKSRSPVTLLEKKLKKFEPLLKELSGDHFYRGQYTYRLTSALIYHKYPAHNERSLFEARLAIEAAQRLPAELNSEYTQRSRLFLASALSGAGKYEESYNTYTALMDDRPIALHLLGDHYAYYVGSAMLLGKEQQMEVELLKHLSQAEAQSKFAMAEFYSGLLIPLYLSAKNYPNAKTHIDRHYARATAKVQANEMLFRIFEVAYYYFVDDIVTCSHLLEKNFPLFYRECEKEGDARLLYLKLVRARLREREEGVPIPKRLRSQRHVFSKVGPFTELSRILLERMGVTFDIS